MKLFPHETPVLQHGRPDGSHWVYRNYDAGREWCLYDDTDPDATSEERFRAVINKSPKALFCVSFDLLSEEGCFATLAEAAAFCEHNNGRN